MPQYDGDVIEQHGHAAFILWLQRDAAVRAPHFRLDDLTHLDGRLDANLDGLRIANNAGWKVCVDELRWREPGEVFVAAALALESGDAGRMDVVLRAVEDQYELWRAVASAFGWVPLERASQMAHEFWNSGDRKRRYIALTACAVHRYDPSQIIADALNDRCPRLRARALRGVGELARGNLLDEVRCAMQSDEERCRIAAAWTVARLTDDEDAVGLLLQTEVRSQPYSSDRVWQLAVRRLGANAAMNGTRTLTSDAESKYHLVPPQNRCRLVVTGIGAAGDPGHIPWLIEQMDIPELARVAGEAFSTITGLDLAREGCEGPWPEGFHAGPTEDPKDENVEMDPDENLPWPCVQKLQDWWARHAREFEPGVRYLCGKPITEQWLQHVLRYGYQRHRAAAALELALRHPGQPLFNVKAPGWRQEQELGLK